MTGAENGRYDSVLCSLLVRPRLTPLNPEILKKLPAGPEESTVRLTLSQLALAPVPLEDAFY